MKKCYSLTPSAARQTLQGGVHCGYNFRVQVKLSPSETDQWVRGKFCSMAAGAFGQGHWLDIGTGEPALPHQLHFIPPTLDPWLCPHLLSDVVPVHVALAGVHLLLVEETAAVGHQQGLAHVLALCSGMEEKVVPL